MGACSTHCAGGAGAAGCDDGIGAVPGCQTGSTGEARVAAGGAGAGAELAALREDRRPEAAPCASPAAFAGATFGSGFMMLTAGIEAALGKSASRTAFFWA